MIQHGTMWGDGVRLPGFMHLTEGISPLIPRTRHVARLELEHMGVLHQVQR